MSDEKNDRIGKDIENLIELFNQSDWDEMHLKTDELEVFLSNDPNASGPTVAAAPSAVVESSVPAVTPDSTPTPSAAPGVAPAEQAPVEIPAGMIAVTAPNLGTFYRSPKPGAPPYVEVGQAVDENTDVCLIEVMKLFTPVKAGSAGRIHAVCVADGTMVEFGQTLVILDPK